LNLLFAWRYFKAKKSANAINIIAWVTVSVIAFATACQILVLSVFNGFEDLVKSLYSSFYPDIRIVPAKGKTFTLSNEQLKQIHQQTGVNAVSLTAEEKALLKNNDNSGKEDKQTFIYLKGVDENYSAVTGITSKIVEGNFNLGSEENPGLVVGAGIEGAADINVDGGSGLSDLTIILPKIRIVSVSDPLQSITEGNAKAIGVFAIQQEFDSKYAITNIDFVKHQMGFTADEYSAAELKLNNGVDLKSMQKNLSALLGTNYNVQTKYEQNTSLYNTMRLEKWFIYAILTLILIIAAFNMISALTMLVLEKKKDISVLQSMGADKSRILKIFLSEGLLLGVIGTVAGIFLATVICFLQLKYKLIKLQGGSFLIDYYPVKLQWTDFLLVSATATIIALVASWFPAYKAAKQSFELRGSD